MIRWLKVTYWKRRIDAYFSDKKHKKQLQKKKRGFRTVEGEEIISGCIYETRNGTEIFINQTTWELNGRIRGQEPKKPSVTWSWDFDGRWVDSCFDLMRRVEKK